MAAALQQSTVEKESKENKFEMLQKDKLMRATMFAQKVKSLANSLEVQARDYDVKWPLDTIQALREAADSFLKLK